MGSIGTMMKLEEALGSVYGTNTVTHMLSGKAFSRAWAFLDRSSINKQIINQTLARSYKY